MTFDEWLKDMERWDGEHYACMDIAQAAWSYQQARIEALEARLKAYELYYGVMTDAAIQYALNSGRGNNPTEKEWLAASVHAEIVKLEARIQTLERVWLVAERLCTAIDSAEQDAGHESIDDILAELGPALDAVEPRPQEPTP